MKLSKYSVVFFYLFISSAFGQFSEPREELDRADRNEGYLFPIEPGTTNLLAGTMGELRSNHFHSGIDIRTGNRIGVPVLSIQNGYVWRVVISSFGFGNAVYVRHPNGQTSVYGHLDRFNEKLARYVRSEQYKRKSFEVDLFFKPGQFELTKGDTIARSGNSGGSSGPHLHFDIRGKNNEALNPLEFHFDEVKDQLAPIVEKVAFNTMDIDSRINDQFGRQEFYVIKNGNEYVLPQPILASGKIGIELLAYDRLDNSRARCGINFIEMTANDKVVFRQKIDRVNFSDTRNILMLMNYKIQQLTGDRYNKLYVDDGNDLNYYSGTINKGFITVKNEIPIRVIMKDSYNNQSVLSFTLQQSPMTSDPIVLRSPSIPIKSEIQHNTLKITSHVTDTAILYSKNESKAITPAYTKGTTQVFLIDLRKILPDSISIGSESVPYQFKNMVPSEVDYKYYSDNLDIHFPKGALFDTTFLKVNYVADQQTFQIGDPLVPLHRNINVTLKPLETFPENTSVYAVYGKTYSYVGGNWSNGKISFNTRDFGNYTLLRDTVPPTISKVAVNSVVARFRIRDDLSGISYYEASLNGEWLLMNYDYKTGMIWSDRLDPKRPLSGELNLKVVDKAGNESTYAQKI